MVKINVKNLWIKCKLCGSKIDIVQGILDRIDNEWDSNEPTGWVQQRLEANDLGVLTHYPIYCSNKECDNFEKKIATLKLDFVSHENNAELIF